MKILNMKKKEKMWNLKGSLIYKLISEKKGIDLPGCNIEQYFNLLKG
jgi:hypothetical protein